MGAIAPSPLATEAVLAQAADLVARTLAGLAAEGTPFVGCLFVGLMLTPAGPRVLEYNCRFGDPETQVVLPLLDADLAAVLADCCAGRLDPRDVRWRAGAAATVVAAAPGYPDAPEKGSVIMGMDAASSCEGVTVFHAGTRLDGGVLRTAGGRVLAVTGVGPDGPTALRRAYAGLHHIEFPGLQARRDVGGAAWG